MGEEETCDPQAILQGSLFAAPVAYSLSSDVDPSRPPSPSEAFKAVWFSYEYYDVSPGRQIEECTETLSIGRVKAAISPDVIHRLQHFYETFLQSQEANPKFSEGKQLGQCSFEHFYRGQYCNQEMHLLVCKLQLGSFCHALGYQNTMWSINSL